MTYPRSIRMANACVCACTHVCLDDIIYLSKLPKGGGRRSALRKARSSAGGRGGRAGVADAVHPGAGSVRCLCVVFSLLALYLEATFLVRKETVYTPRATRVFCWARAAAATTTPPAAPRLPRSEERAV